MSYVCSVHVCVCVGLKLLKRKKVRLRDDHKWVYTLARIDGLMHGYSDGSEDGTEEYENNRGGKREYNTE